MWREIATRAISPSTSHCWCHRSVAGEGQGQLSMALGHQRGFTWPLVVTWPTDIYIDPYCGRTTVPDITIASGASAGFSCQCGLFVPGCSSLPSCLHHCLSEAPIYHTGAWCHLHSLWLSSVLCGMVAGRACDSAKIIIF